MTIVVHPDTPLLLYNGLIKKASEITNEDVLMGDDSSPRNITELKTSKSQMYKIVPIKGEPFIVGGEHMLTLILSKNSNTVWRPDRSYYDVRWYDDKGVNHTLVYNPLDYKSNEEAEIAANKKRDELNNKYKNTTINISVSDYINKNKTWKTFWKLVRTGVEFNSNNELHIDPYLVGLWLGDGNSSGTGITNIDKEIIDYLNSTLPDMDMNLKRRKIKGEDTIHYYMRGNGWNNNVFLQELQNTNMIDNKHIPHKYKFTSKENRLSLLAGLIDTDGSLSNVCYEITQKSTIIADDILFLARSCGLSAYNKKCIKGWTHKDIYKTGEYNRMHISGDIHEIPVLIKRKIAKAREQIKSVLNVGFTIETAKEDSCACIYTSNNNRIVLGDFTITGGTK